MNNQDKGFVTVVFISTKTVSVRVWAVGIGIVPQYMNVWRLGLLKIMGSVCVIISPADLLEMDDGVTIQLVELLVVLSTSAKAPIMDCCVQLLT